MLDFFIAQAATGFNEFLQTLIRAMALGSVYVMVGLGFVIIFKGTQVLNFAAAALSMSGAMIMSILVSDDGLPLLPFGNPLNNSDDPGMLTWIINLLFALVLAAIVGLIIERLAIRPMIGQSLFAMAIITFGIEIALRPWNIDATALEGRSLEVPWRAETWALGESPQPNNDNIDAIFGWWPDGLGAGSLIPKSFIAAIVMAAIAGAVVFFFFRSRFGIAMRAVAFDQEAAMAQGINVGRVFAIAWAMGVALSALGGIAFGMAPFPPGGSVSQEVHQVLAFRVLPVIVLGGLDSVIGVIYGGLIIAAAEVFAGQYLSQFTNVLGPGYSTVVPYLVMLVVLVVRPHGLFGTPEVRRV